MQKSALKWIFPYSTTLHGPVQLRILQICTNFNDMFALISQRGYKEHKHFTFTVHLIHVFRHLRGYISKPKQLKNRSIVYL